MNKSNVWQLLEEEIKIYPEDFGGAGSVPATIDAAQKNLGLRFSQQYTSFIKNYGSAILPGHIIYGLISLDCMGKKITNVIEKTNFYRSQKWPGIESWYVVSDDGFGNPIGIDPEGKVWLSDHDAGFEKIKLADSFEEFLYKVLTETLYE